MNPDGVTGEEFERAKAKALLLLSYQQRTRFELSERLSRPEYGFSPETAAAAVKAMDDEGLIDDRRYAADYIFDKTTLEFWGRRRIAQELNSKGVAPEIVGEAFKEALAGADIDDDETARLALTKRYGQNWRDMPPSAKRKAIAYLFRLGHDPSVLFESAKD